MEIDDLAAVGDMLAEYGIQPKKSFGQNFLFDLNVTDKIVRAAADLFDDGLNGKQIIEIGPGPGALTRSILQSDARHLTVVEMDDRMLPILNSIQQVVGDDRLTIHIADALETDITQLCPTPRVIISNLPYNIATPLIIGWLKQLNDIAGIAVMVQREVAERMVCDPGSKTFGRLSVICQWLADVEMAFTLPPDVFIPPPNVESAIVTFSPKSLTKNQPDFKSVERVTQAAFGQRRKMLRSSLKQLFGADAESVLHKIGIAPTQRPEKLSVDDFIALARAFAEYDQLSDQ
jgi:16S rRNA (adenine1518-N6/adenine1519-N6)-dimethyltransferase